MRDQILNWFRFDSLLHQEYIFLCARPTIATLTPRGQFNSLDTEEQSKALTAIQDFTSFNFSKTLRGHIHVYASNELVAFTYEEQIIDQGAFAAQLVMALVVIALAIRAKTLSKNLDIAA